MMPPHLGIRPTEQGLRHAEVRVGDYEDIAADQDMNDRRVGTYAVTVSNPGANQMRARTSESPLNHDDKAKRPPP